MESFYFIIALITAGIALAMGLVSLFTGLHKDGEKIDIVFGIMCTCLFVFFVIPPVGFVLVDKAPYPLNIDTKRIFMWTYLALYPWFFELYTGYKKRTLTLIINILLGIAYITMALTQTDSTKPLWVMMMVIALGIILVYGLLAGYKQLKTIEKTKAHWFLFAMGIYTVLYIIGAINQLGNDYFGKMLGAKIFYPFNLNPLAFILIMGVRLRANTFEKFRLEKILRLRDIRWHSLLEDMQLIIVALDKDGKVIYINPCALKALGYASANELINKNWFDNCLPPHEASIVKALFRNIIAKDEMTPYFKNAIISKEGKQSILNWTNVLTYDDNGILNGCLSIGSDVTEQENAYQQIQQLKNELEKENLFLKKEQLPEWMHPEIIGKSKTTMYAMQKAKQVAPTNASVLLEGETGVGKELFADLIQQMSLRKTMPFIKVNCGSLPAELIEDELFGHEKGAFTGAIQSRKGRFEMADGGTIFLDEIGELPLALQPKLLRVLQKGEFERVGGQQTIKVDVRIISATNRDLGQETKSGKFREDLFYRLNVFPITIPALRDRKEDIPLLIQFYISRKAKKHNKNLENISKADMQRLCDYTWPGNIRELKNVIERSVISSEGSTLKLDWFYHGIAPDLNSHSSEASLGQVEKTHILKVLEQSHWKINGENGAAEKLDMHPSTLRSKMKKLNINRNGNGTV